jgi:hypothetical protein
MGFITSLRYVRLVDFLVREFLKNGVNLTAEQITILIDAIYSMTLPEGEYPHWEIKLTLIKGVQEPLIARRNLLEMTASLKRFVSQFHGVVGSSSLMAYVPELDPKVGKRTDLNDDIPDEKLKEIFEDMEAMVVEMEPEEWERLNRPVIEKANTTADDDVC